MVLAITYCIVFSQLLVLTEAHHMRIVSTRTCSSLSVAHGGGPDADSFNINVTVSLVRSGTQENQFCYENSTNYSINIRTSKAIMGMLMVQDEDKLYGKFANTRRFGQPQTGIIYGFCSASGKRSISHLCSNRCNFGTTLNFPYRSPNYKRRTLEFRYSMVFSYHEFYQNVTVRFPPCPAPTPPITTTTPAMTTTPTSKPIITCNVSDFNVVLGETYRAKQGCPNSPTILVRDHTITERNIVYNCTVEGEPIKRKTCGSGCLENGSGKPLCCRVRATKEQTEFWTCTAISRDVPENMREIRRALTMTSYRKCECFRCEDVCRANDNDWYSNFVDFLSGTEDFSVPPIPGRITY